MTPQQVYGLLLIQGIRALDIAKTLEVDVSTVSLVINGKLVDGQKTEKIRNYISEQIGLPPDQLFSGPAEAA